jgi:hypothetical protein
MDSKEKTSDFTVDRNTLLRYLLGGSLLGAGAGAATSLTNHFNVLRNKAKKDSDTSYDDNIIYVNVGGEKKAFSIDGSGDHANSGATLTASLIASLVGGIGSYNFVRNRYLNHRKKTLQEELDRKQQIYIDGVTKAKSSASQWGPLSQATGATAALLLLASLGTAATTNKILSNYFPGYKASPAAKAPRVVVRRRSSESGEGKEKHVEVSTGEGSPITAEEVGSLLNLKHASGGPSSVGGVVQFILQKGVKEAKEHIKRSGVEDFLRVADTLPENTYDKYTVKCANYCIALDPLLRNSFAPLIAADAYDDAPYHCKVAAEIEDVEVLDSLSGIFKSVIQASDEAEWGNVKEALGKISPMSAAQATGSKKALMGLLLADFVERRVDPDEETPETGMLDSAPSKVADPVVSEDKDVQEFIKQHPELVDIVVEESQNQ